MNMVAFNHIRAAARSLAASTDVTLHVGDLSAHLTRRASPLVSHQGVEFTAAPGDGSRALRAENARFRLAIGGIGPGGPKLAAEDECWVADWALVQHWAASEANTGGVPWRLVAPLVYQAAQLGLVDLSGDIPPIVEVAYCYRAAARFEAAADGRMVPAFEDYVSAPAPVPEQP